jgi:hypothetical protein
MTIVKMNIYVRKFQDKIGHTVFTKQRGMVVIPPILLFFKVAMKSRG